LDILTTSLGEVKKGGSSFFFLSSKARVFSLSLFLASLGYEKNPANDDDESIALKLNSPTSFHFFFICDHY